MSHDLESWTTAPVHRIDLDAPASDWFLDADPDLKRRGLELIQAVRNEASAAQNSSNAAAALVDHLGEHVFGGRVLEEASAIGDWLEVSREDILLGNCAYDLTLNFLACSGVAMPSSRGPVLARNMDFWPEGELARCGCVTRAEDRSGLRFENLGWPGSIGVVSGLSGRGFALSLNAVFSTESPPMAGFPVMLFLRLVLETAGSFDEALAMLSSQPLASACLILLVGTENDDRVVIERTPTRFAVRRAEPGRPLVVTNHYVELATSEEPQDNPLSASACRRFDTLSAITTDSPETFGESDAALLYALTEPDVLMDITAQHVIMRPSEQHARLIVPRRFV